MTRFRSRGRNKSHRSNPVVPADRFAAAELIRCVPIILNGKREAAGRVIGIDRCGSDPGCRDGDQSLRKALRKRANERRILTNSVTTDTTMNPRSSSRSFAPSMRLWRSIDSGASKSSAGDGQVVIATPWREEAGQSSGFLHAALVGALIDMARGYAAFTMVGHVLAAHDSVDGLRPAVGERFVARARVVKPGKSQVFTVCEMAHRRQAQRSGSPPVQRC